MVVHGSMATDDPAWANKQLLIIGALAAEDTLEFRSLLFGRAIRLRACRGIRELRNPNGG